MRERGSRSVDDGQDQTGRVLVVMEDAVDGWLVGLGGLIGNAATSVGVTTEPGPVAAGDLEADPVSGLEHVGRRPHVDADLVRLTRVHKLGMYSRAAEADALNAVGEIDGAAVGETSTSLPVRSVSGTVEIKKRRSWTGPMTSTASVRTLVL